MGPDKVQSHPEDLCCDWQISGLKRFLDNLHALRSSFTVENFLHSLPILLIFHSAVETLNLPFQITQKQ